MPDAAGSAAIHLLAHLRDLARARRAPVREVAAYAQVFWLGDLPEEVHVETDAGSGDVLFSVPQISMTPPAVLEEFDGWLGLRRWYRALRTLAEGADESAEHGPDLVLATGLLSWQPAEGVRVRDHLLTTPVRVTLDERTERVDVIPTGRTVLRDRDLLDGLPHGATVFRPARTEWLRDAVHAGQGHALQDSVADVLRKWCTFAFDEAVPFRDEWTPEPPATSPRLTPRVRLAPALVVRPQQQNGLTDYFDALLAELSQPGARLPAGLARFLAPQQRERVLHIEDRSAQTLADMLLGLLSRGQRVLVATAAEAGAGGLLEALPDDLAPLCVPATGMPEAATADFAARHHAYDPYRHERHAEELALAEAASHRAITEAQERLRRLAETETFEVAPGYRGTLGQLAGRLRATADAHGWFPVGRRMPVKPPLTADEAAALRELLVGQTAQRAGRTKQALPEPASLPAVSEVRALVDAQLAARDRGRRPDSPTARLLRSRDPVVLGQLDRCSVAVATAMRELGLLEHGAGAWDPDDWAVRALNDGLQRSTRRGGASSWDRLTGLAGRVAEAERALRIIGPRRITLPAGDLDLASLIAAARGLRDFLKEGGALRRGPLKSAQQRQAEPLLSGAAVDGAPPTTVELLDVVLAALAGRLVCKELARSWETVGVAFSTDGPLARTVGAFANAFARLSDVRIALLAMEETKVLLSGTGISLNNLGEWHDYDTALETVRLLSASERAADRLAVLHRAIELEIRKGHEPPELHQAAAALTARDVRAYERCMRALAEAHGERLTQARCEQLYGRLHAVHPELADLMTATAVEAAWPDRLSRWDDAWTWGYVAAFLKHRSPSQAETRLRNGLHEAEQHHRALGMQLAVQRAWGWTLSRIGAPAARIDLAQAAPAWIVSLAQVPGLSFREDPGGKVPWLTPPRADSFDVVIVDHKGGVGAEALFLLWLAPRVIVVGPGDPPDLPTLPVPDPALPAGLDQIITPNAALLDVLTARFNPPAQPEPAEPPPVAFEPQPGRSIVTYKAVELVALIDRLAAEDPSRTDDQLVARARALLECPADEFDLVGARLHYAVEHRTRHP